MDKIKNESNELDSTLEKKSTFKPFLKEKGHSHIVESVVISPDNKYIVSGSCDNTIKIWDFKTKECLKTLEDSCYVNSLALSHNGKYIVSGNEDNTIKVWDFFTGKCLKIIKGHFYSVTSVIISPDGQYIILDKNGRVKIWDFYSGDYLCTIDTIYDVSIDKNGYFLGNNENVDKCIRISDTLLSQRRLTKEEIIHFRKKEPFIDNSENININKKFLEIINNNVMNLELDEEVEDRTILEIENCLEDERQELSDYLEGVRKSTAKSGVYTKKILSEATSKLQAVIDSGKFK